MKRISIEKTEYSQSEEKKEKQQQGIRSGLKAGCGNTEGMVHETIWVDGRPILKMS